MFVEVTTMRRPLLLAVVSLAVLALLPLAVATAASPSPSPAAPAAARTVTATGTALIPPDENPASVIRVVRLLVPDKSINHGVDVIRLELVPERRVFGLNRLPYVAIAVPGMIHPNALVPCCIGEEKGNVCGLGRGEGSSWPETWARSAASAGARA